MTSHAKAIAVNYMELIGSFAIPSRLKKVGFEECEGV